MLLTVIGIKTFIIHSENSNSIPAVFPTFLNVYVKPKLLITLVVVSAFLFQIVQIKNAVGTDPNIQHDTKSNKIMRVNGNELSLS
jgi:hypothetical protein